MGLKGVIDLGSNSVRLVVYETEPLPASLTDTDHQGKHKAKSAKPEKPVKVSDYFTDIVNEKVIAGLSAYVQNGDFTQTGINRTVSVLQKHLRVAGNVDCKDVQIFATAVIRNCGNSKAVVAAIEKAIGKRIHLLSDAEEAHLGFVGATCDHDIEEGTLIDIGGGSTELTRIRSGQDHLNLSVPQGSVSSYAAFVEMILPKQSEISNIKKAFKKKLSQIKDSGSYEADHLFGIGGSVRALPKLRNVLLPDVKPSSPITPLHLDEMLAVLQKHPSEFAHACTKASPGRVHTIVPGAAIARVLLDTTDATDLTVCKYGVREGYLLERMMGLKDAGRKTNGK